MTKRERALLEEARVLIYEYIGAAALRKKPSDRSVRAIAAALPLVMNDKKFILRVATALMAQKRVGRPRSYRDHLELAGFIADELSQAKHPTEAIARVSRRLRGVKGASNTNLRRIWSARNSD